MSSIDRDKKNNIYLTLYQSQICQNNTQYLPYSLSISYNDLPPKDIYSIKTKKHYFNEKIINFKVSSSRRKDNIIILSAYTKTMFVLKNTFAKVKIPFNLNKTNNNQKQWYFLKDNEDEIVLKILISILSEVYLHQNNSMNALNRNGNKSSEFLGIKSTHNNSCFNLNSYTFNLNNNPFNNNSMSNLKANPSLLYNIKNSNHLISILENENDNNITVNENNEISNFNLNISFISINEINKTISNKVDFIFDLQNNVEKNNEFLKTTELNYKKKKYIIEKEKEKLKDNRKKLEKIKQLYENKNINLQGNIIKLNKSIYRYKLKEEIEDYNKKIFSDLNFIISNTNDLPNIENNLEKINSKKSLLKSDDSSLNTNENSNYNSISSKKNNNKHNKANTSINLNLNYNSSIHYDTIKNSKQNKFENFISKHSNSINLITYGNAFNSDKIFNKHHSPSSSLEPKKIIKNYQQNFIKQKNINDKEIHSPKNNIKEKNRNSIKKDIVEFDNIKVITIKHSKSKSNILNNEKKKINFSNNIEKKLNNNYLSKSNSNTINSAKPKRKLYDKKTSKIPLSKFSLSNDINNNNNNQEINILKQNNKKKKNKIE